MQTVICAKWGTRYPSHYVNCLWSMIKRNTRRETQLICYTDDLSGIDSEVITRPLPQITLPPRVTNLPWRKIGFWSPDPGGISGDVLFLDLDLIVTGSIDEFFDYEPQSTFCVIENWTQMGSGIGNTSVYRFRVGSHTYIYDALQQNPEAILSKFPNSQTYISRTICEKTFWPKDWCESFKHTLMPRWPMNFVRTAELPSNTKVVAFTGRPDIDEAARGDWSTSWWKRTYKHVRPTPWIMEHWR